MSRPSLLAASLLGAMSCGASDAFSSATLTLVATAKLQGSGTSDASGLHVVTAAGHRLTVTRALLTVSSVELFPCSTAASPWRWLSPVSTAWAHGVITPRRLAVPNVLDATGHAGVPVTLGQLSPPAARYCSARLTLGPADADGAAGSGFPGMTGRTVDLAGELTAAGASTAQPFALTSQGVQGASITLPPLVLKANGEATLALELPVEAWLDGVDVLAPGAVERVLANAAASAALTPP